jgi:hypothetical protein
VTVHGICRVCAARRRTSRSQPRSRETRCRTTAVRVRHR